MRINFNNINNFYQPMPFQARKQNKNETDMLIIKQNLLLDEVKEAKESISSGIDKHGKIECQ